jgi:hypothetical protein
MKNRASRLDARVDKVAAGFTIIETILFIAIAGLVFTGVVAGTNGAIRRQRYKDTVQSFTDDLRDLYSIVENTEVLNYGETKVTCGGSTSKAAGRGRSSCSVYGIIAKIKLDSEASGKTGENIEAYWIMGEDEKVVAKNRPTRSTDSRFLKDAGVSSYVYYESDSTPYQIEAKKASLYWGSELKVLCSYDEHGFKTNSAPCQTGKDEIESGEGVDVYLMIYRSPISRNVRTMVAYTHNNPEYWGDTFDGYGTSFALDAGNSDDGADDEQNIDSPDMHVVMFGREEVKFCITPGQGMSSERRGLRMVSIKKDASTQNDVRLVEADDEENLCNR